MADGFEDAFAQVAGFVVVAEFVGLVFAGGSAGRDGGAADGAACYVDFGFDGGIAAGVNDFAGVDFGDFRGHGAPIICLMANCAMNIVNGLG